LNSIIQTASSATAEPVALYTFDVFDTLLTRIWLRLRMYSCMPNC